MLIVVAARLPSTSFVLATLRALHVDRLLTGDTRRPGSNNPHLHPQRRVVGILSVV
jgi:hypothetical protein